MKAIDAWQGRWIEIGKRKYEIDFAFVRNGNTFAEVYDERGNREEVSLQRAAPIPNPDTGLDWFPTAEGFVSHVRDVYGPPPYQGCTAQVIRTYVKHNPQHGVQWVSSGKKLQVAQSEYAEVP